MEAVLYVGLLLTVAVGANGMADLKRLKKQQGEACGTEEAGQQYSACFSQTPWPSSPRDDQTPDVITAQQLQDVFGQYCLLKVKQTQDCFMEWLATNDCSDAVDLTVLLANTGRQCTADQPASWMTQHIFPKMGDWHVQSCGKMASPLVFCREQHGIQEKEANTEEMDAVIDCILRNMDKVSENCDQMVALYDMLLRMTLYADYGVGPSDQAIESLKDLTFATPGN